MKEVEMRADKGKGESPKVGLMDPTRPDAVMVGLSGTGKVGLVEKEKVFKGGTTG